MSGLSLDLVLRSKNSNNDNDKAKIQIKSDKFTPFGAIFLIMEQFVSMCLYAA